MATTLGALINALGILLGAILGMALRKQLSLRTQVFFRSGIGGFTFFFGLRLMYDGVNGPFLSCLKQLFIAFVAVVAGFWVGKIFRIQKASNYLGRLGSNAIVAAQNHRAQNATDGFNACAILFCAAPLGIIGAVTDGLSGFFYLLAVKAVMDALAMWGFVKIFRWPAALSAVPVFVFFSAISMSIQLYVKPFLNPQELDSITTAA